VQRLPRQRRPFASLLPAGVTGYLLVKGLHPALPGWPCPLRALSGVPCPTCFLTRATALALHGDLGGAVELHAFGPLAAAALIGWSVLAIRQRQLWPQLLRRWNLRGWLPAGAAIALLGYWLLRLGLPLLLPPAALAPWLRFPT
jgi:hypothetical protein